MARAQRQSRWSAFGAPRSPISVLGPVLVMTLLLSLVACGPARQRRGDEQGADGDSDGDDFDGGARRPPTIVKSAPVDVRALVNGAPTTAGTGAHDEAADVVAACAAAGLVVTADAHVGRFLRGIFFMVAQDQQPSGLLAADMAERLGVGGVLSHSFIVPAGDAAALAAEINKVASELGTAGATGVGAGGGQRLRVGVARETLEGTPALFVGFVPSPITLPLFERKVVAGAEVKLTGTWHDDKSALKFYVDNDDGGVASDDVVVGKDGAFLLPLRMKKEAGVVRVDLVSVDDNELERDVYSAAFYVGDVPALADGTDDATPVTAAGVIDVVNRLRAAQKQSAVVKSPLLDGALQQKKNGDAAIRGHLARSGFLVRNPMTQTFLGLLTLAEFERMTLTSPWVRSMNGRGAANQLGVVVSEGKDGSTVELFSADVSAGIDPVREAKRAADGVNRARARAKQKALIVDAAVESKLQAHVAKICTGEVPGDDQGALQVAIDPALRQRRFTSISTYVAAGDDVTGSSWARNFKDVTSADFNTMAVGACNGPHAAAGQKNAVLVVLVLGKR